MHSLYFATNNNNNNNNTINSNANHQQHNNNNDQTIIDHGNNIMTIQNTADNNHSDHIEMPSANSHMMSVNHFKRGNRHRPQIEGVAEGLSYIIEWLLDTYEMADGESLPRSIVYMHYQNFCSKCNVGPVNPASFGKLIRSVFANIKTRRLGTRGHSKYHYFGIKIKSKLSLLGNQQEEHNDSSNSKTDASVGDSPRKKLRTSATSSLSNNIDTDDTNIDDNNDVGSPQDIQTHNTVNHNVLQSYLISEFSNLVDDNWLPLTEQIINGTYNGVVSSDMVSIFEKMYQAHYRELIESIFSLRFNEVERIWYKFWHPDESAEINFKVLYRLTLSNPILNDWIVQTDHNLYSAIETGLLPDLLSPVPRELNQEIRQFAKNIGPWMEKAVQDYESSFSSAKSKAVRALGYTLRRYTALNHLATSARPVWDSRATMQQMYMDLGRVDLKDVQNQATLITRCTSDVSDQIVSKFMVLINSPKPSEVWDDWCRDLVKSNIRQGDIESARRFLLRWNFYSSLIMKDLTLRSSSSFGSFHLIRLLFDEYIFYLVVCQLAQAQGKTPTQLLCEANDWIDYDNGQTSV